MKKITEYMERRSLVLYLVFCLVFIFIIIYLSFIVFAKGKDYGLSALKKASANVNNVTLNSKRGVIVDRNGIKIADSKSVYNIIFDPKLLLQVEREQKERSKDKTSNVVDKTISTLSSELNIPRQELEAIVRDKADSNYVVVARNKTYTEIKNIKQQIDGYILKGVFYEEMYKRVYPYPQLASNIIGFIDGEGQGVYGLERYYNDYLVGEPGRRYGTVDRNAERSIEEIQANHGYDMMLTLDYTVQKYINEAIAKYYQEHQAKQIHVIVMNPQNGEIIGMANYPDYNLSEPRNLTEIIPPAELEKMTEDDKLNALYGLWKNNSVTDTYEYGSTFKPFVYAMALEENIVPETDTFMCNGGLQIADHYIRCWKKEGHGRQTLLQGLQNSCNVVFMEVSKKIGRDIFYKYQHMFGFGAKTGIDIPGEVSSENNIYTLKELNVTQLATSAFGQGFNGTPIQLITGFSSLINGGNLYEPHIMKKIYNQDQVIVSKDKELIRQTISQEMSMMTRQALAGVVNEGTGKKASVAGYEIGGKTGTAEKHSRDDINYIVSFIGFAPVEDPKIITLVVVDEPVGIKIDSRYAAGIFVDIMEKVMPYLHIFKNETLETGAVPSQEAKPAVTEQSDNENGQSEPNQDQSSDGQE